MTRPVLAFALAVVLAMPPQAQWFSATMPRHQLLQVPAMLLLGAVAAHGWRRRRPGSAPAWDPAILVLAVGAMMFWMVPRSLDLAASSTVADQLLHVSWFLAGAALSHALPRTTLAVTMALGIHGVAMVAAIGLVYTLYPGLICTAYNMEQQRATGHAMLYAAPMLAVVLWGWAVRRMASPVGIPAAAPSSSGEPAPSGGPLTEAP